MDIRGLYGNSCSVCGKPARVHIGKLAYCLDCYNHLSDYLADVPSPTNDSFQILALDPDGHAVEFSVERFSLGVRSEWTAVELVPEDDPRREWSYVGRSISISADMDTMTQEEALDALAVKVQHVVGHASVETHNVLAGQVWKTTARRPGQTIWAQDTGIARIDCDEDGNMGVVVDGQFLSGEQFLDLLSNYEGFDLYWQMRDRSDDVPDWL